MSDAESGMFDGRFGRKFMVGLSQFFKIIYFSEIVSEFPYKLVRGAMIR